MASSSTNENEQSQSIPQGPVRTIFNSDLSYLGKAEFKKQNEIINTKIYVVRLNKLIDSSNTNTTCKKLKILKKLFKLTRLNDLTHTITALYDTSLPDLGVTSIYECICSPKAYTICVVKDSNEEQHVDSKLDKDKEDKDDDTCYSSEDCLSTIEDEIDEPERIFKNIFSDEDQEEEEEQEEKEEEVEESNEPDHTKGLKSYLTINKQNSKTKNRAKIIKNLIAIATLERVSTFQLPGQDEWIIDLQLMSVREKYRGFSIGKFLISLIQNRNLVGNYDAIVTCSDSDAIHFYEKYAFCVDAILNSKYSHIGDLWTNTTKMCFVPPYCSLVEQANQKHRQIVQLIDDCSSLDYNESNLKDILNEKDVFNVNSSESLDDHRAYITELTNMERDFKRWQKLMFSSYQYQSKLFYKLKQEILTLKAKLCAKDSIIDDLKIQNDLLIKNNKLLKIKMNDMLLLSETNKNENDENIEKLIADLEKISN